MLQPDSTSNQKPRVGLHGILLAPHALCLLVECLGVECIVMMQELISAFWSVLVVTGPKGVKELAMCGLVHRWMLAHP